MVEGLTSTFALMIYSFCAGYLVGGTFLILVMKAVMGRSVQYHPHPDDN
ncbi:MAG: hypothetical protein ACREBU_00135 [Nitrososphaera sp.]